jgi:hypothetical protein
MVRLWVRSAILAGVTVTARVLAWWRIGRIRAGDTHSDPHGDEYEGDKTPDGTPYYLHQMTPLRMAIATA